MVSGKQMQPEVVHSMWKMWPEVAHTMWKWKWFNFFQRSLEDLRVDVVNLKPESIPDISILMGGNYQPQMVGLFLGLRDDSIMGNSWNVHGILIELPLTHQSIEGRNEIHVPTTVPTTDDRPPRRAPRPSSKPWRPSKSATDAARRASGLGVCVARAKTWWNWSMKNGGM